ncbi:MAG: AIPR family protein [Candidatus Gastranaerophilales bacterium]|nr:AIPR family protein [Candidatus Gastranaerophilales bacterium]
MFKNLILQAWLDDYVEENELIGNSDCDNERRYIDYIYFSQIQPDRLDRDFDLLNQICDETPAGMGLIGIAITMNGQLLSTKTDIDDILQKDGQGKFEIYILAYKGKVSADELINEIYDKRQGYSFSEIIAYLQTQKIVSRWEELPDINIVFIAEEKGEAQSIKSKDYTIRIWQIDEEKLLAIAKSNRGEYQAALEYKDSIEFGKLKDVGRVYVVLCNADSLVKILINDDGLIRTNIFDDNVRDYQGDTDVNQEMEVTLSKNPVNFVLFNNGITIVCDKLESKNRALLIKNPQVVNGCQTCNSLYKVKKKGKDLSQVQVIVKVIEATEPEVTQGIVKGTNRQNIVYEAAFETVRQYHKELEDFFNITQTTGFCKVYYERRSKQYTRDRAIKPYQRVSFRALIQSMVAMYMNHVETAHRHESKLISDYKDKLFVEGQSYYPYYVAALFASNLECIMKQDYSLKDMRPYKLYLLFLIQELCMGPAPDINDKERIEEYCKKLLNLLSKTEYKTAVLRAADRFRQFMARWVMAKGSNYRYSIKDNPEFKDFMLRELRGSGVVEVNSNVYTGRVMTVTTDKHGNLFGFIAHKPENIYFNELDNPNMDISYEGKKVSFRLTGKDGKVRGINVKVL